VDSCSPRASATHPRTLGPMRRPSSFAVSFALTFVLATALAGCAYRTPPTHVPHRLADAVPASVAPGDVTVVDATGDVDPETVASVRQDTARILARTDPRGRTIARDARMSVHVELLDRRDASDSLREDGFAIFGLWPVVFGMICERQKLAVDVTIEHGGQRLVGHGTAEKLGGIYAPARRRALAVALDEALANAARGAEGRPTAAGGG
jgi:hypothetical protein